MKDIPKAFTQTSLRISQTSEDNTTSVLCTYQRYLLSVLIYFAYTSYGLSEVYSPTRSTY